MLTPLFYEDPLYCLATRFFKFWPTPLPTFLLPPIPTPTVLSVVLFLWINGWSRHIWCAILLNDNMDLHVSSYGTLVPEGPWCMFYAIRHQVYWGLTHVVVFYWYSDLISHTQTHTAHSGASRLTHSYNIYLHHLLCAHSSYLYYVNWLNK